MSIKKLLAVIRWEYVEKVRTKAFIISLVLTPAILAVFMIVPGLLASKPDTETKKIGIIDKTGAIEAELQSQLQMKYKLPNGKPNYQLVNIPNTGGAAATANKMVLDKSIEAYLVIDSTIYSKRQFQYVSENVSNFRDLDQLQSAVKEQLTVSFLQANGVNPKLVMEATKPVDLETVKLSKEGKTEKTGAGANLITGYIFIVLMAIFVLTSGQLLVRSVIEEKSNRIVEVLLSSVTSDELIFGKIFGLSLLGLTQLAVWAALGVSFAGQIGSYFTLPDNLPWLIAFFFLGYFFYATLFVMAGAPVTTEQEAQQVTGYVSMALWLPMIVLPVIIQDPNASYVKLLSFIPIFTPTLMAIRIPVQSPALWELATGAIILLVSTYVCMIAAARIFRIGILVYGKRPSLKELLRWATQKG